MRESPIATVEPALLRISEVCETLRLGRSSVYELIKAKKIELVKIGTASRVTTASVRAYLKDLSDQVGPLRRRRATGRGDVTYGVPMKSVCPNGR